MKTLFFAIAVFSTSALAQPASRLGGLPGSPFRMGFGAEGMGLANAMSAVTSESIAGYYNPALLPFQPVPAAFASVGFLSLDRSLNFLHFTRALPPSAGISIGLINSGVGNIEGRDSDGRPTETLSTSENAFLLSFGVRVHEHVAIGISTKILYYQLYDEISSTTVGFDFGALVLLTEEITAGASFQDVGSKYKWDTSRLYGLSGNSTADFFPVRKKLALSYRPDGLPAVVGAELEVTAKIALWRVGIQYEVHNQLVLRGGLDQYTASDELAAKPTFGFSTHTEFGGFTGVLSYAFVAEPYAPGGIHMISLGARFP